MHKIENNHFIPKLEICGKTILESECEKLLGLLVNNTITWKNHLHGHEENPGLITTLSKRVRVLSKLRKYMSKSKFKQISAGLFLSKLSYGISVWSGVWNTHIIGDFMKTSISKRDMRKLQTLQNKTLRLETCLDRSTPTETLISATNSLSVHQLAAKSCLVQVFNIQKNKKPRYHHDCLFGSSCLGNPQTSLRSSDTNNTRIDYNHSLCFFFQGSRLWSSLPPDVKNCSSLDLFKPKLKVWIKDNISLKL